MPQVPTCPLKALGKNPPLTSPSSRAFSIPQVGLCLLPLTFSLWGLVCVFEDSLDLQGMLIQHGLVTIFGSLYVPIFKARAFFEALGGYKFGGYYLPHSLDESEAEDHEPTLCSWPKHRLFLHTQSGLYTPSLTPRPSAAILALFSVMSSLQCYIIGFVLRGFSLNAL